MMQEPKVEYSADEYMETELTNLKIEKQDSNLFEIPAGYKKMSMPSMPGMKDFNMDDMIKKFK